MSGFFGIGVFIILIGAWSFSVAYFLVIRRGRVMGDGDEEVLHVPDSEDSAAVLESIPAKPELDPLPEEKTHNTIVSTEVHSSESLNEKPMLPQVPANLPTGTLPASFQNSDEPVSESIIEQESSTENALVALENRAHKAYALFSSEALRFVMAGSSDLSEQMETLDYIIERAKATFPSEDGWVVVNKERIAKLLS